MSQKIKFKIGEFSKLCQVTVKTLRHYEEVGLMLPREVDRWTGYRYYDISQLRLMNRIVYLKRLGFSLDEIAFMFDNGSQTPDTEAIRAKTEQARNDVQQLMWRQAELAKLELQLHNNEKTMEKVIEKRLPSRIFATHRRRIDSYQELFNLCPNIIGPEMERLGCKCSAPEYCFTVEHQPEYDKDIDIEYFEAVEEVGVDSEIIKFKTLPEAAVALCINHHGSYLKMPETFAELFAYAEANGYEPTELARFCYIDGIWNKASEEEWLTEIQLPVRKA